MADLFSQQFRRSARREQIIAAQSRLHFLSTAGLNLNRSIPRLDKESLMSQKIGIFGVSNPYVWNLIDLAHQLGLDPTLVANKDVPDRLGLPATIGVNEIGEAEKRLSFFPGVVRPESKRFVVRLGLKLGLKFNASLISNFAYVGESASYGAATIVREFSRIGPMATLGNHVTISPCSSIEHHTSIGDFSHVADGVSIGGGCEIGASVFVGIGAAIRDGIKVGEGAVVGMGAVVVADVAPGVVVAGNPARIMPKARTSRPLLTDDR